MTNWADQYVGIPFKDKGRDISGIDCWGLLILVYKEKWGIELPSFSNDYITTKDREATSAVIRNHMDAWVEIEPPEVKRGDGVLMKNGGKPSHVGIVVMPRYVLHIEEYTGGSICQDYTRAILSNRIVGFYRYIGPGAERIQ